MHYFANIDDDAILFRTDLIMTEVYACDCRDDNGVPDRRTQHIFTLVASPSKANLSPLSLPYVKKLRGNDDKSDHSFGRSVKSLSSTAIHVEKFEINCVLSSLVCRYAVNRAHQYKESVFGSVF